MAGNLLTLLHNQILSLAQIVRESKLYPHAAHHYHDNHTLKASVYAIVAVLFVIVAISKFFKAWRWTKLYVLARPLRLGKKLTEFGGSWAVVTGASDGIGKEYARQLAARGLNVALVARNREKLNSVAKLIQAENPKCQTQVFVIDFSTATLDNYRQLEQQLKTLENDGKIGVLVNNVGMAFNAITRYHEYPEGEQAIIDMINVNITPAALISRMVLPGMLSRRNGAIINISSVTGVFAPVGLLVIYPQTKLFLRALSAGLADEYEGDGITVQSVCPGLVVTNLAQPMIEQGGKAMAMAMSTDTQSCVAWALAQVGMARETFGHPKHALTVLVSLYCVPHWVQKLALNSKRLSGQKLLDFVTANKEKAL